jgi:hypothetical protein
MKEVLIKFETEKQAEEFVSWFSNSGEQDYFQQEEFVDDEENIVDSFEYDYKNNIIIGTKIK